VLRNFTSSRAKFSGGISGFIKSKKKQKQGGILMASLPLAACGGGGSAPAGGPPVPPPAPDPTFTENPTNVFVAIDDSNSTLSEGGNAANLTVTGKAGADSITTGSGADIIDGAAGNDTIISNAGNDAVRGGTGNDTITTGGGDDHIRGGEGLDDIKAGDGNDAIVVVGTTTAGQYSNTDINNPAGSNTDLSDILTIADLNGRTVSEVAPGDTIDGGAGINTLFIYGTVDLTGVTLTNVTVLVVNSDVTLSADQMKKFTTIDGDGTSIINIEVPPGDTYVIDLSTLNLTDIGNLNMKGDVTFVVNDASNFNEIGTINTQGSATVKVEISGNGSATTVNLGDINAKINNVDTLDLNPNVTLKIDNADDITKLGLNEIAGGGNIDTGGNNTINDALNNNVTVPKPTISINDIAVNEATENATFTVTLSKASHVDVTIDYVAPDETNGTLTFNPGETEKTFTTQWTDDTLYEDNETVVATLTNPSNATILDATGQLTIIDDDSPPTVSIDDIFANEADEVDTFTVSLSAASDKIITVDYAAPDGTTGTLTFNPGETTKTFTTVWTDDSTDEANEVLNATLFNSSNALISGTTGQLTILDDDNHPTISINDISTNEADETDTFTVSLSAASGKLITVDYDAPDGSNDTLSFNPGETSKSFSTSWADDSVDEDNETVVATLANPSNATIADGNGTLTIIDDDIPVEPLISDELFTAILAIDAANRGYFRAIELSGNQIGRATIIENSSVLSASDVNASFFAQAYSYNGGITISFRGTDDDAADEVTGWPLGRGDGNSVQGLMALDFYQYVYDNVSTNIDLTGNSMGGGLAGFVGSIKSQDAVIFNSMPYYQGAVDFLDPQLPDQSVVSGYRVSGEWLEFEQGAPDLVGVEIDHGDTLNDVQLHDLSVLVIGLYMVEQNNTGSWRAAEQYFWPVLYDDSSNFAARTGTNDDNLDGFLQDSGYYGSILKAVIAYSTINEGTRVFGDTAIRSFYNDANDLGAALTASGQGSHIEEFAQDISYTFTHMAGRLGLNKVLQSDDQGAAALKGILTYSAAGQNNTLTIELSDSYWDLLTGVLNHNADLSRQELISEIVGANSEALDQASYLWGNGTYNVFGSVIFNVEGNTSSVIAEKNVAGSGANFFIGDDTANEVTGSSSTDMIQTELGNDFIIASASSDAINGGNGLDTMDYSLLDQSVTVEISPNASFDFIIKKGALDMDGLNSIETIIGTDGISDIINIDQSNILSLTNPENGVYLLDLLNDGSSQLYRFEGFETFNTDIL